MEFKFFKTRNPYPLAIGILMFSLVVLTLQLHTKIPFRICYRHDEKLSESWKMNNFTRSNALEDFSYHNDEHWFSTVMPKNEGFISIRHNETFNIEWGISMFHQMHCLSLLRAVLQREALNTPEHPQDSHSARQDEHADQHFLHQSHLPHCIGYLAQVFIAFHRPCLSPQRELTYLVSSKAIMCAGDGTIERPWVRKDDAGNIVAHGVDGVGTMHRCRNTDLLWSVSEGSAVSPIQPWDLAVGDTVERVFGPK